MQAIPLANPDEVLFEPKIFGDDRVFLRTY
jgi:hypothetical protein